MVKQIHVTPRDGLVVGDPDHGGHLPPEGRNVTQTPYWLRRIRKNDVKVGKPSPRSKAAPAAETAKPSKETR